MVDQEISDSKNPSLELPEKPATGTSRRRAAARDHEVVVKLSPGGVLSDCFAIYFRHFLKFTAIALLVYSPLAILRLAAEGKELLTLIVLLSYLMPQLLMAAIIYGVFRHLEGKKANVGDCISTALSRLLPVIGTFLLMVLAIGAISIIPLVLATVIVSVTSDALRIPLTCLAMIPGMWIYCALYAAIPAVVAEKSGVRQSFRRSQILTRGNRMRIFLIFVALSIFAFLLQYAATFLLALGDPTSVSDLSKIQGWIMFVIQLIPSVLLAVAAALVFFNLKVIVEGADEKELASVFD